MYRFAFRSLRGSIRPECIPEDSLADKILTKPPLSPENKCTNVSNVGFCK